PSRIREESRSATGDGLTGPTGYFFAYAPPSCAPGQGVVMLQVANGRPAAPPRVSALVVSRANEPDTEAALDPLLSHVIIRDRPLVSIDALSTQQRLTVEALLGEINRLRARTIVPARSFQVHEMRLVTSISAKQS